MKKPITLRIEEPCHEKWSQMTPTEKGRFCQLCTKEVIDFTHASDEEIVKLVSSGKSLCGRFTKSQLDRPLELKRKTASSWVSYAASLLMPLSILANNPNPKPKSAGFTSIGIGSRANTPLKSIIKVNGYVFDHNHTPIQGAQIFIVGERLDSITDDHGYFELKCPSQSVIRIEKDGISTIEHLTGSKDESLTFRLDFSRSMTSERQTVAIVECNDQSFEENPCGGDQKVSGTVVDESGYPLPGVNVIIEGTSNGTQTDFDGKFSIDVKVGQTVVFSYVGYETQSTLVSSESFKDPISMQLYEGAFMGEVVIVGYVISYEDDGFKMNAYSPTQANSFEETEQRKNRKAYEAKVNAWKAVKNARRKAQRKSK